MLKIIIVYIKKNEENEEIHVIMVSYNIHRD